MTDMDLDSSFLTFSPKPKNISFGYKKATKMSLKHQEHLSPHRTNILQDSANSLKHDNCEHKHNIKTSLSIVNTNHKVDSSSRNNSKLIKSKIKTDKENCLVKRNKTWNNVHLKKSLEYNAEILKPTLNTSSEIFNDNPINDRYSIDKFCKRISYCDSSSNSNNSSHSDILLADSSSNSPSSECILNNKSSSSSIIYVSDSSPSPSHKVRVNKTVLVESDSECEQKERTPLNKNVGVTNQLPQSELAIKKKFASPLNTTPEFSVSQTEDILNMLYGNDWDKEKVLPMSTPQFKNKDVHTDSFRRKDYCNQSSSSEDDFDNFIRKRKEQSESIRKKALTSLNFNENFLTDDSVEESSIVFYHSVLKKLENKRNDFLFSVLPKKLSFTDKESDCSSSCSADISVSSNNPPRESPKGYSFLESLSSNVPMVLAHPKAKVYKANFNKSKEELAKALFKLFNTEVFENKLPADLNVTWNARLRKTAGLCHDMGSRTTGRRHVSRIELSTKVCNSADRLRDTIIHEMCHAAVWIINQIREGHGPHWRYWAKKAMKRFPELPKIERCHDYEIETKFTYQCENCGYSIGRQSKSLNLATQRCGYCVGQFVLLVNKRKKTTNGQPERQLATPRAPSAFASFVKENYSIVKQSNSSLKHGEVMKCLGQKFAALKMTATDKS